MGTPAASPVTPRWLGISELEHRLGVSRCSIWRWLKASKGGKGSFPKPAYFGARRAWLEADIAAWEAERKQAGPRAA